MFGSYPKSNNYCDPEIQYKEIVESTIIDKIIIDDLKQKPDMNKFKSLLKNINNYVGNEINASQIENTIKVSRRQQGPRKREEGASEYRRAYSARLDNRLPTPSGWCHVPIKSIKPYHKWEI